MPVINPNNNDPQRSTFRPPWVKEGPSPLPMPSTPWTGRSARDQNTATPETKQSEKMPQKPILKKQTKITIPIEANTDHSRSNFENGQFTTGQPSRTTEKVIPIRLESPTDTTTKPPVCLPYKQQPETTNQQPVSWRKERQPSPNQVSIHPQPTSSITSQSQSQPQPSSTIVNNKMPTAATSSPIAKPAAPPMPPMSIPPPPPPPMMMGCAKSEPFTRKPISTEKAQKLESLRSRPRRRPDWSDMMKEVEQGRKLKHVQCNDRSAPVIPSMKTKGQFVYESENKKDETHNKLLKQIQTGVKLKKIKCNDRSRPNLDGLRKFRRQMTTEDLIQKSVSMADVVAAAVQPDELDDIDKVRDDLQSAKQMLALELRNKEAMERENKRLMARLTNLEVELEKEKNLRNAQQSAKGQVASVRTDEDEKLIMKLKEEATEADRIAKDIEQKYHTTAEELDNTRRKLESAWLLNQHLEMQLKQLAAQGTPLPQIMKQPSMKRLVPSVANGGSIDLVSDDDEDESETETEEESDKENSAEATQERQIVKELRLLTTKLRTYREKQAAAMKERRILREQLSKRQKELKEEKKKYKLLQKEVDKMAKLMRESDDDDYEDEQHTEEDDEEETDTTDSSSEESEEEEEEETELPFNATAEDKKKHYLERIKRHENRLSSLKKGNYLMKANIERLQDDMNKQREMSLGLQEDLNNILADLG